MRAYAVAQLVIDGRRHGWRSCPPPRAWMAALCLCLCARRSARTLHSCLLLLCVCVARNQSSSRAFRTHDSRPVHTTRVFLPVRVQGTLKPPSGASCAGCAGRSAAATASAHPTPRVSPARPAPPQGQQNTVGHAPSERGGRPEHYLAPPSRRRRPPTAHRPDALLARYCRQWRCSQTWPSGGQQHQHQQLGRGGSPRQHLQQPLQPLIQPSTAASTAASISFRWPCTRRRKPRPCPPGPRCQAASGRSAWAPSCCWHCSGRLRS